jgi:hypothetical protein
MAKHSTKAFNQTEVYDRKNSGGAPPSTLGGRIEFFVAKRNQQFATKITKCSDD